MSQRRGLAWVAGSFVFCPCHLPLTLALAGSLLAGTALGTLLSDHPIAAGVGSSAAWIAGTWRGMVHLRRGRCRRSGAPSY